MNSGVIKKKKISGINIIVVFIVISLGLISFRMIKEIKSSNENLRSIYVKLLNTSMPVVKEGGNTSELYDENIGSFKSIFFRAIGLADFNNFSIVNTELSFFSQNFPLDNHSTTLNINPFKINDDSITKIEGVNISDDSLKKSLDNSKPEVLIYHTHSSEGFEGGGADTTDENYNIIGVGNVLAKELEEKYGISVIHDKTNHSVSYNDSYSRSYTTLSKYVNNYKEFKLVIDLHRDYASVKSSCTATVNGVNVGKISFVTSKGSPYYAGNKEIREEMIAKGNELFPGLINNTTEFNQGLCKPHQSITKNSLLIECGAQLNTPTEAQETAKIIARLIAEKLNKK